MKIMHEKKIEYANARVVNLIGFGEFFTCKSSGFHGWFGLIVHIW